MESLGVEVITHMPAGSDGRRTTARAKGKVERPFRTVKDAHETLYHFHEPETEAEANRWLARYVASYNRGDHRSEPHSRIDDWLAHLPAEGVRQMCAWERFCVFAREPERRLISIDCRLTVAGVTYEVDAELAGETRRSAAPIYQFAADPATIASMTPENSRVQLGNWIGVVKAVPTLDNTERLKELRVPTLVIWGSQDSEFTADHQKRTEAST